MGDYQLTILSPQGDAWDVTERVSTLSWSGSVKRVSRQIEAVMATPNDGSLPELPCDLGNELRLSVQGAQRFLGHIVTREKATDSSTTGAGSSRATRGGTPSAGRRRRRRSGPCAPTSASR